MEIEIIEDKDIICNHCNLFYPKSDGINLTCSCFYCESCLLNEINNNKLITSESLFTCSFCNENKNNNNTNNNKPISFDYLKEQFLSNKTLHCINEILFQKYIDMNSKEYIKCPNKMCSYIGWIRTDTPGISNSPILECELCNFKWKKIQNSIINKYFGIGLNAIKSKIYSDFQISYEIYEDCKLFFNSNDDTNRKKLKYMSFVVLVIFTLFLFLLRLPSYILNFILLQFILAPVLFIIYYLISFANRIDAIQIACLFIIYSIDIYLIRYNATVAYYNNIAIIEIIVIGGAGIIADLIFE